MMLPQYLSFRWPLLTALVFVFMADSLWHAEKETRKKNKVVVVFKENTQKRLNTIYDITEREIPVCLFGSKADGNYVLERLAFPKQYSSTDSTVTFDGANCESQDDFLGYVHNHDPPDSRCEPTPLDSVRFSLNKESEIELIACTHRTNLTYHPFQL